MILSAEEKKNLQEKFKTFPEYKVYFMIEECGGFIWRMNHDLGDGRIEDTPDGAIAKDIERIREIQQLLADELPRFGVKVKNKTTGRVTEDYIEWYNYWHDWHKGMSDEQWRMVNNRLSRKEDITEFLPEEKDKTFIL